MEESLSQIDTGTHCERTCVVTVCIGDACARVGDITLPLLGQYARKIGADFISVHRASRNLAPHFEKLSTTKFFLAYDRMILADADLVISPECPNLFDLVAPDRVGGVVSSEVYSSPILQEVRARAMKGCIEAWEPIPWDGTYLNTGLLVLSREHEGALSLHRERPVDAIFEQTQINYNIARLQIPVEPLEPRFNWMPKLAGGVEQPAPCYVLHAAGVPMGEKLEWIKGAVGGLRHAGGA